MWPTENESPGQTHFTHSFSKHLTEHVLCVRPWGNRNEKDTVLVLLFNVVRMSDSSSENGKALQRRGTFPVLNS